VCVRILYNITVVLHLSESTMMMTMYVHAGMWDFLVRARLGGVDLSRCLYVGMCNTFHPTLVDCLSAASLRYLACHTTGDAAGRAKDGTRKKDFADTDYKLALNIGIKVRPYYLTISILSVYVC